jgi:predicted nucleic acid-binding protein
VINYDIKSEVVDINKYNPTQRDSFFIDSNVLIWVFSTKHSRGNERHGLYQSRVYPAYIHRALKAGSKLYVCGLSFSEMSHFIEDMEFQHFSLMSPYVKRKEYRHNYPTERSNIIEEINSAWSAVSLATEMLEINVDRSSVDTSLSLISNSMLDGYDVFLAAATKTHGIVNILTDDGDFSSIEGVRLFTANYGVLRAAEKQGKLASDNN